MSVNVSAPATLCNLMDCSPPGSSVHGDSPDRNTWVGCHALLQGIFPTQGSNPHFLHLLHHKQILYPLSHLGSLRKRIIQNKKQYYNLFRKPIKQSGETIDFKKLLDYSKALELYQKTLFRAHIVHGIWLVIINIRFNV